jgi:putative lipase involved disintegration of autophagic bodies
MLNLPHRFNSAIIFVRETRNQFPEYKVVLTGHSLGGSLAQYTAIRTGLKCETFNPGNTPLDSEKFAQKNHPNIKQHHINWDPVSAARGPGRKISYDIDG